MMLILKKLYVYMAAKYQLSVQSLHVRGTDEEETDVYLKPSRWVCVSPLQQLMSARGWLVAGFEARGEAAGSPLSSVTRSDLLPMRSPEVSLVCLCCLRSEWLLLAAAGLLLRRLSLEFDVLSFTEVSCGLD